MKMVAGMLSIIKYPFEYEFNPTEMDKGKQWLTLTLKNIGSKTLKRLDVELHSLDTFYLFPFIFPSGIGHYIGELKPDEEREKWLSKLTQTDQLMYMPLSVHVRMETTSGGNPVGRISL